MKIEFISDVVCPWCAIGFNGLERALDRIGSDVEVELHIRPFELNPDMAPEGEDVAAHLARKYTLTAEQLERNRAALRERGATVGVAFGHRERIWNTFDAHRLLQWAGLEGRERALKQSLLNAYHERGENVASHEVLARLAGEVGLDAAKAREVLASDRHADEVRTIEHRWQRLGIHSVPTMLIDGKYMLQGGHPPEVIEQALREIAAESPA